MNTKEAFETVSLPKFISYLAPDCSEIRLLKDGTKGGLCECTLGPGAVTDAVRHKVVEELWYVISGAGQLWRKSGRAESIIDVRPGTSLLIPVKTSFQFRAGFEQPLIMLLATMPTWQHEIDAKGPVPVEGLWQPKSPPVQWKIQGNWWQCATRDDGSHQLALLRIARRDGGLYRLSGQSWEEGWNPRARFASEDGRLMEDDETFAYSWTGNIGMQMYRGTGAMIFSGNGPDDASGFYEIEAGNDIAQDVSIPVRWSRMGPRESLPQLSRSAKGFNDVIKAHFTD